MTGLLLLFLISGWVAILGGLVFLMLKLIKPKGLAVVVSGVFSVVFMCAPVYDEIIGGYQFRDLCAKGTILNIDEEKAKNRVVYLKKNVDQDLSGYYLPITYRDWQYLDVETKEHVLGWREFSSKGGRLMRFLGISETGGPLTFEGNCYVRGHYHGVFKRLNITQVSGGYIHE